MDKYIRFPLHQKRGYDQEMNAAIKKLEKETDTVINQKRAVCQSIIQKETDALHKFINDKPEKRDTLTILVRAIIFGVIASIVYMKGNFHIPIVGIFCGYSICLSEVLAQISYSFAQKSYKSAIKEAQKKLDLTIRSEKEKLNKKIDEENARLNKKIEEIRYNYTNKYNDYVKEFEQVVLENSVQMIENESVKEIADWMTEGYYETIDAADRSTYIKTIDVPFVINVYKHKITCNLGELIFEEKRFKNLTTAIKQAAVARAVGTNIHLNLTMKYPQDISGSAVDITVDYSSSEDSRMATIRYKAANGNYQAVKDW